MFQTIFFDLDGTVTDPKEGITKSVQYAQKKYGITVEDLDTLCPFIGPPLYRSFEDFYGFSHEQALEAVKEYRVYYHDTGIFECKVYEGIPELLCKLRDRGCEVVMATSKPEEYAIRILEHFGIASYFTLVAGSTMSERRVEKPDILRYAIDRLMKGHPEHFDLTKVCMVGDRKFDYIGAKQVGMPCILVGFGYGERQELEACKPYAIVDSVEELGRMLGV